MLAIGICTSDSAPLAGVDFIEENVQTYFRPETPDHVVPHRALPVPVANSFLPAALPCVGPAVDQTRLVRYATAAFQRAQQASSSSAAAARAASRTIFRAPGPKNSFWPCCANLVRSPRRPV